MYKSADTQLITHPIPVEDSLSEENSPALHTIQQLCHELAMENISYCHWKSNNALFRSASGDNDLDLLVSRADVTRFTELLYRLGFKLAEAPAEKQMPGVQDYFGYDAEADKLIHVHAHYQLVIGHDMTKNYCLPIETAYLESATQGELFRVPSPEFEFVVFVIRMVLKHSTWDTILGGEGKLNNAERQELAYLKNRIDENGVHEILINYLPYIDIELFENCVHALEPSCSLWRCVKTGHQLQSKLKVFTRFPPLYDTYLKIWRRAILTIRRRFFKSPSKYKLASGGAMVAIVGGDGSGKTTVVDGLSTWLSKYFEISKVHMGKPSWSLTTIAIRGILKLGNLLGLYPEVRTFDVTLNQKSLISPGYPWLIREVCRARDRYLTHRKARRFAANGGLVILDRFPLPQIKLMDRPLAERFLNLLRDSPQADQPLRPSQNSGLVQGLVKLEKGYYQDIVLPKLTIVLRVFPEIAVKRKVDEEPNSIRERTTEIWQLNWDNTGVNLIEASKSKEDVLAEIKAIVWLGL